MVLTLTLMKLLTLSLLLSLLLRKKKDIVSRFEKAQKKNLGVAGFEPARLEELEFSNPLPTYVRHAAAG